MVNTDYKLENNAELSVEKYIYIVNSYFLVAGSHDAGQKMEALIEKKVIRTIESSNQ
ncbi:MAG: hypothetical protein FWF45_06860 [Coriobacteriia bacterium]|nr:hypothetical protein [Coriobacteriia bacterium]